MPDTRLPASFTDFRVDTISINSYSDVGDVESSVFARGALDNLVVTTPAPPVGVITGAMSNGMWRVQFAGRTNWNYTLLRSVDLRRWTAAQTLTSVTTTNVGFVELFNSGVGGQFFRVLGERP